MKLRHVALLVLSVGLMVPAGAGAQDPIAETRRALDDARAQVESAQADVDSAQSAANEAAEAYFAAIDEQERLDDHIAKLEAEIAATLAEVDRLATEVRVVVVNRYVAAEQAPGVLGDDDVNRAARADALSRFVANSRLDAVDEYRLVRGRLDDLRAELDDRSARQVEVVADMAGAERDANDLLAALTVERERLDQRVAELAAEEARLVAEEEARRQAEEARRQAELEEQRRAEEAARQQALAANPPTPATGPEPATNEPAPSDPSPTAEPEIPAGSAPSPATGWVCPVAGPTSFIDSWGAPRASGRWHKGTDMMANEGIPVVAVVGGTLEHRGNSVGGLSAHLTAPDGTYFYYTHLSGYANEGAGSVAQGTVIGYVGMTGNAPVPHLHFEHHPADVGGPVNPYPTLIATC